MLLFKGFDSLIISDEIELPKELNLLLNMPFLHRADLEEAYKYGGSDLRSIIDKAQLTNTRKYVNIETKLQFLTPNVHTVPKLIWHIDTSSLVEIDMDIAHLLITDCTAMTEFIEQDLILMNFDDSSLPGEVMPFVNKNQYMFTPKSIEPNKFYTFGGKHLHRCVKAQKPEFRFTVRILESDLIQGSSYKQAFRENSMVYRDLDALEDCTTESLTKEGTSKSQRFVSISRKDGQIIINTEY